MSTVINSVTSHSTNKRSLKEFQTFELDLKQVKSLFKKPRVLPSTSTSKSKYTDSKIKQLKLAKTTLISYYVDDLINRDSLLKEIENELVYNEDGLFLQNEIILNNLINIVCSNREDMTT